MALPETQFLMSVSIYSINAQGLKNTKSRNNLINFINSIKPTVVCVQETNINTLFDTKLIIPNYLSIYNSAAALGSGTVFFCVTENKNHQQWNNNKWKITVCNRK